MGGGSGASQPAQGSRIATDPKLTGARRERCSTMAGHGWKSLGNRSSNGLRSDKPWCVTPAPTRGGPNFLAPARAAAGALQHSVEFRSRASMSSPTYRPFSEAHHRWAARQAFSRSFDSFALSARAPNRRRSFRGGSPCSRGSLANKGRHRRWWRRRLRSCRREPERTFNLVQICTKSLLLTPPLFSTSPNARSKQQNPFTAKESRALPQSRRYPFFSSNLFPMSYLNIAR